MNTAEFSPQDEVQTLYRVHHSWLVGWLRRRMGDASDAADVAQDVFVRLLARGKPVEAREPRAFLSTVANGLVVEQWRRKELERAWLQTLAALPEAEVPSLESQAIIVQTLVEVDRLLDQLKPAVRTAFLLAQLDGLTCPQIAKQLGVSLATVERYIAQALRACYTLRHAA